MRRAVWWCGVAALLTGCADRAEPISAEDREQTEVAPSTTHARLPTTTTAQVDESLAWVMANIIPWNEEANTYLAELTAMPTFDSAGQLNADGRRALCAEFGQRLDEWEASMSSPPSELAGAPEYVFEQLREAAATCVAAADDVEAATGQQFTMAWGYLAGLIGATLPEKMRELTR